MHGAGGLSDGAQDHGHGKRAGEGKEEVDEEVAGRVAQADHEVEGDVEGQGRKDFRGKIADDGRHCLGKGVVEGVTGMFLDDGALSVEGEDLRER